MTQDASCGGWATTSNEDIPESQHVFRAGIFFGQGAHVERMLDAV